MPSYSNLNCIESLIDVVNPCNSDQSSVEYFLDDLGISLDKTAKIADERYITGQNLVDNKVRIALDEVYSHLTRNVSSSCDLDKADGILCDNASRIARAVWYKTAALILKELTVETSRYNDYVHYAGSESLASLVYYDDSFKGFTNLENVNPGRYQQELNRLESIRTYIEQVCCGDCSGSYWGITLP